ncbi:hypothetical protein BGW39_008015 [Mortierella sp. 14UC]|nr:hypothetical protein BGW39_008015 [Mortierella sp. 14UC]
MPDIGRYLPLVRRFKALSCVIFVLDRELGDDDVDLEELTPRQRTVLNQLREGHARNLDQMLVFAQEHRQHHPGVLQRVEFLRSTSNSPECPKQYELQLHRLLPPLIDPVYIYLDNLTRFVAKVKETNLSVVKVIEPSRYRSGDWDLSRLLAETSFLHRCRSLEKIVLSFVNKDVKIEAYWPLDVLDSQDISELAIGNSNLYWDLLLLSTLDVQCRRRRLRFYPDLLFRCRQLNSIALHDDRRDYSLHEVIHYQPFDLPQVGHLDLQGTPAISLHPDSLKTTTQLTRLSLGKSCSPEQPFIPPVERFDELDQDGETNNGDVMDNNTTTTSPGPSSPRRPIWTWDWDLPELVSLKFASKFAFQFQFRMLHRTPSLMFLSIILKSELGLHKGRITL